LISWFKRLIRDRAARNVLAKAPPIDVSQDKGRSRCLAEVEATSVLAALSVQEMRSQGELEDREQLAFLTGMVLGLRTALLSLRNDQDMDPAEILNAALVEIQQATDEGRAKA
jgi:hypothetical protein